MTFRYADEALAEFIAAGTYFNRQVPGLGDVFAHEIEAAVAKIVSAPLTWRIVEDDVRRYLVRRFPYGVYYTVEGGVVIIWAVKHLRRAHDYWQQRRK
jgi:toxin ParE1/3/4